MRVSDPNAATMAQKVIQYQAALQLAQTAPQLYDLPQLHRQMLDVIGIKNYQKLVPMAEDMKPRDPVTENMNILSNKPVKAFIYQDHQAHIAVHMSAMQDPKIQSIVGMNPQMAQQLQAVMMAHVFEHLGMEYRKQVEMTMRIESNQEMEGAKLAMNNMHDQQRQQSDRETDGAKAGIELMKHQQQMAAQLSQQKQKTPTKKDE